MDHLLSLISIIPSLSYIACNILCLWHFLKMKNILLEFTDSMYKKCKYY